MKKKRNHPGPHPMSDEQRAASLQARLWAKIDQAGPDGCWLWKGSKNPVSGKAHILADGQVRSAAREVWKSERGPIPDGCFLNRRCGTPECTNPDHYEVSPDRRARSLGEARISVVCPIDGKSFFAWPSEIARGGGKYCSRKCKSEGLHREVAAAQGQKAPKPEKTPPPTRPILAAPRGRYQKRPLHERLYEKVDKNGPIPAHKPEIGPCWLFRGATTMDGRGQLRVGRETMFASRVSYELANGPLPSGLQVNHHCDNRQCVRPSHLWAGTQPENMRDMAEKGRSARFPANHPERMPRGEAHHAAKLTNAQVEEMLQLHAQGWSRGDLAQRYGISAPNCGDILRGKSWKHVPRPL